MMKFENKGKWVKQINESIQRRNEVRYIDPANVDKYDKDEIEEVTLASGEKRYKRKQDGMSSQSLTDKDIDYDFSQKLRPNKVDWKNLDSSAKRRYDIHTNSVVTAKKMNLRDAYSAANSFIQDGTDTAFLERLSELTNQRASNGKLSKSQYNAINDALSKADKAFQSKDTQASANSIQELVSLFNQDKHLLNLELTNDRSNADSVELRKLASLKAKMNTLKDAYDKETDILTKSKIKVAMKQLEDSIAIQEEVVSSSNE